MEENTLILAQDQYYSLDCFSKNEAYEFMKRKERALNAGCMINNYTPTSFNELVRNNEAFKSEGQNGNGR